MSVRSFFAWGLILGGGYVAYRGAEDYFASLEGQKTEEIAWQQQQAQAPARIHRVKRTRNKRGQLVSHVDSRPAPRAGSAVARLSIPRLNSTLYVVEGTDDRDLKRGPGHLEGTVRPGDQGNCVIAGHRDTHFRVLKDIHQGDVIVVESDGETYRYRVTGLSVVPPENTQSLQPTSKAVLNLITCFPFEYVGSAPRRFIVHADLISS